VETDRRRGTLGALRDALKTMQDDLSLPELVALLSVAAEPGLSVNDLAERIGAPQQSTSRFVAVLLRRYTSQTQSPDPRPFIVQTVSPDDPRRRALHLADRGKEVLAHIVDAAALANIGGADGRRR